MANSCDASRDDDARWMRLALSEAWRGQGSVEPNPMVGAAVVREGRLVALGHHERFGGPHAEVVALARAGEGARGATLYVTLEPCCHVGKTPPCADAVIAAGIARVVAAQPDPFPRVDGGGFARLRAAGVAVEIGCGIDQARQLNAPYLKRVLAGRPYVIAKWAMTLDGKIGTAGGDSRWISNARSRAMVHALRGRVDAVAVGLGTVLADDPRLTARPPGPRRAARLVLDSAARIPLDAALVRSAGEVPTWVACTNRARHELREALSAAGCVVLSFDAPDRVPIDPLLADLAARGVTNVLVEGGGRVAGAFFDAGAVDEVWAFLAPTIEGGDHSSTPVRGAGVASMNLAPRLEAVELCDLDGDAWIRGLLRRPWWALLPRVDALAPPG